jgi:hypothetical protein
MSESPERVRAVQGPVVVGKAYDLVLWLVQKVEKFPLRPGGGPGGGEGG